jgi:hypothetical protein
MSRALAGLHLSAIVLFWLIAWIPLALYCVLSIGVGLFRSRQVGQQSVA